MVQDTTLVVMAAGIGSRFGGGIKQLEPVGPNGEIIMDYSIHDALEAGFNKVIFIIRRDLEQDFKQIIGHRIEKLTKVEYAYQELEDLPAGFIKPEGRTKPWGTGQAVLSIQGMVHEPFLVINADDYYGKTGFKKIHEYMIHKMNLGDSVYDMCMGGFILSNTLSENGGVTRGVCVVNPDETLKDVTETYDIYMEKDRLHACDENGNMVDISPKQHVSMNMWGLPPKFIDELNTGFCEFLSRQKPGDLKSEYLLPAVIDSLVKAGRAKVTVLETPDKWFGVTYKEDKQTVVDSIKKLYDTGVYSS